MSRLLLDTHALIWWLEDNKRLNEVARAAIGKPAAMVHVSAATIWEISIKARLGRITLGSKNLAEEVAANHFLELPISAKHAEAAGKLALHHDDPFDRMLIAQALAEELTIVTHDKAFKKYKVSILWT